MHKVNAGATAWQLPISLFIGFIIAINTHTNKTINQVTLWHLYWTGLIGLVVLILLLTGIIYAIVEISIWVRNRRRKSTKSNPITAGWRAWKNKYCTKINWN